MSLDSLKLDSAEISYFNKNNIQIKTITTVNHIISNNKPINIDIEKMIEFLYKINIHNLEYNKCRFTNSLIIKTHMGDKAAVFKTGYVRINCTDKINYDNLNNILCSIIKKSNNTDSNITVLNPEVILITCRYKFSDRIDINYLSFGHLGTVYNIEDDKILIKNSNTKILIFRSGSIIYKSSNLTDIVNKHKPLLNILFESQNQRIS